ncbi:MAG: LytTR family DNA-binding domain-containing protein [Lachnospiraceae bacterium]|nr:LytTR family DNA-binding domain-containing protein [Lachnospiraceae bacterium]
MRIAIADDFLNDREKLSQDICRWAADHQMTLSSPPALFDSGEALLEGMKKTAFDVIFLDIYMGGMTGMEAARKIRAQDPGCRLIFITQTADFAVESYDVNSSWYLLKPYSYEKLSEALSRCCGDFSGQEESLTVPCEYGYQKKLYIHDIAWTEYGNRRVTIHKKNGENLTANMRQGDLAQVLLAFPCFCDCMKGVLVNLESVEQFQKDCLLLKGGQLLPISRLKYQAVREQFLAWSYAKIRGENV